MAKFTPQEILRRQLWIAPLFGAGVVVIVWIYWAFAAFGTTTDQKEVVIRLVIALLATIATPVVLFINSSNTGALIARGVSAQGTVAAFGKASSDGRQQVVVTYTVRGVAHQKKTTGRNEVLDRLSVGSKVLVIYDSANPSRAQAFLSESIVEPPQTVGKSITGAAKEIGVDVVWTIVVTAQIFGAIIWLAWMGKEHLAVLIGPAMFAMLALSLWELWLVERLRGGATPASKARARSRNHFMILFTVVAAIWLPLAIHALAAEETDAPVQPVRPLISPDRKPSMTPEDLSAAREKLEAIRRRPVTRPRP